MPARNAEFGLQRPTTESVGDVRVAGSIKSSPAVNVTPRTCVLEPKQGVSQLLSQPRPCLVSPNIEQAVGKLKRFKRIALRCEKTAQNYGSFVALALGFILIKSVHTA
jgi:hypothetical protein